jgi:hypothetical protein
MMYFLYKNECRGEGGRNDPNIVCTYEYNKKKRPILRMGTGR